MNKYFKTNSTTYETIRSAMDSASGYPNDEAESWFCSTADAPKDSEGNCLIAAMPAIAEEFLKAGVAELTAEEYQALLPVPSEDSI